MPVDKIKLELTKSEAIVLFELVSRFCNDEKLEIKNQAEERVIWDLCSQLESILVEPFNDDYNKVLAKARKDVVGKKER